QRGATFEAVALVPGLEERLLHQVLGVVERPQHAVAVHPELGSVALRERDERGLVRDLGQHVFGIPYSARRHVNRTADAAENHRSPRLRRWSAARSLPSPAHPGMTFRGSRGSRPGTPRPCGGQPPRTGSGAPRRPRAWPEPPETGAAGAARRTARRGHRRAPRGLPPPARLAA